jgi:hypothetical protein
LVATSETVMNQIEFTIGTTAGVACSLQRRDRRTNKSEIAWGQKSFKEERRAYYRLLRYLVGKELSVTYKEDQARPLPPRIADLLKKFENHELPKPH